MTEQDESPRILIRGQYRSSETQVADTDGRSQTAERSQNASTPHCRSTGRSHLCCATTLSHSCRYQAVVISRRGCRLVANGISVSKDRATVILLGHCATRGANDIIAGLDRRRLPATVAGVVVESQRYSTGSEALPGITPENGLLVRSPLPPVRRLHAFFEMERHDLRCREVSDREAIGHPVAIVVAIRCALDSRSGR